MMYDLWESLLLESELESQVNQWAREKSWTIVLIIIRFSLIEKLVIKENGMFNGKRNLWSIR